MRAVDPSAQGGDTYARSTIDATPAAAPETEPVADAAPAPRKLTRIRREVPVAPAEGDAAAK